MKRFFGSFVLIALLAQGAAAQQAIAPGAKPDSDIIIRGEHDGEGSRFTRSPRIPGYYQIESGRELAQAETFTRCSDPDPGVLRAVLEGPPNQIDTVMTQGRFTERHIGCHLHYTSLPSTSLGANFSNTPRDDLIYNTREGSSDLAAHPDQEGLGRGLQSLYDRGAMREYVFAKFVPDLDLTKAETHDQTVIDRFNTIEQGRNRFRWPEDLAYFKTAVCMVQAEPEMAVNMLRTKTGSIDSANLGRTILWRARACASGAKRVQADPTQFRIYVGEALYRWVEAARGADSLIPES